MKHYLASDAIIRRVKVGIVREVAEGERRVGLVPETVGRLVKDGFEVVVETGAGRDYNLDENYEEAGATIVEGAGGGVRRGRHRGQGAEPDGR